VGRRSRIVGPAVVGDSVEIAEDCFLGSSVVMGGARLAKGTRVWRSILGPRVRLSRGECVSQSWVSPEGLGARAFGEPARAFAEVVVPSKEALRGCNWRLFSVLKRSLDILGSLAGLAATLPLYPFIAAAIKLETPGPVFFMHRRQTLGGKEFGCLKFRSMVQNAHALQSELPNEVDGPQFHIEKDPRLTRVGQFLRRTNLDEIPQLLNVLVGHMSLVGPRPSPDGENQYCPAWREARLSVRAGLTGMWQVERGPRTAGDFQQWVHLDTKYVREVSLRTDLRLLWKTIRQFLRLP
jgi:lipopolysaccharide/colanic/teichoic acid biosynthesis glycosyltransferase